MPEWGHCLPMNRAAPARPRSNTGICTLTDSCILQAGLRQHPDSDQHRQCILRWSIASSAHSSCSTAGARQGWQQSTSDTIRMLCKACTCMDAGRQPCRQTALQLAIGQAGSPKGRAHAGSHAGRRYPQPLQWPCRQAEGTDAQSPPHLSLASPRDAACTPRALLQQRHLNRRSHQMGRRSCSSGAKNWAALLSIEPSLAAMCCFRSAH